MSTLLRRALPIVVLVPLFSSAGFAQEMDSLAMAVLDNDIAAVERLIAQGVDLDNPEPYTGNTALTMACGRSATVEIAKRLIEAGADVHAQGNDGRTALMWASGNSGELVRMLLEKGADPAVASPVDGATALGECLMGNLTESVTIEVCDLLVERGANVDAEITQPEQLSGYTSLMAVAYWGRGDLVEFLLTKGADANHQAADGNTALMRAAEDGDAESVRLLLAHGADPALKNGEGKTALDIASEHDNAEAVEALSSAGT